MPQTNPLYVNPTTGNIGIGTNQPAYPIHVVGTTVHTGSILPSSCNVYDLGTSNLRWRDLYLKGNTIDMDGTQISRDTTTGGITIKSVSTGQPLAVPINTGNIGIGTTFARAGLDVLGSALIQGNLGIGTTLPTDTLHVSGNIYATGTLRTSNLQVLGDTVILNTITSNTEQMVITNAGTGPALKVTQTGVNSIAEFYDDNGVIAMKVADGGSVGIGTTTPQATLDVNGSVKATSYVGSGASLTGLTGATTGIYGNTSNIPVITVDANGRISTVSSITVAGGGVPGQIGYFARNTPPFGWLECNGTAVSRTTYSLLFAAIGTTFGAGNGTTTFNLPDLRGEFIRGWDNGRGVDTGRGFASSQADAFKSHGHSVTTVNDWACGTSGTNQNESATWSGIILNGNTTYQNSGLGSTVKANATGGTETRPRNVALLPCIKYTDDTVRPSASNLDQLAVTGGATVGGNLLVNGTIDSSGILTVGMWNNVGTAADNTTYGLERSRYTIQFPTYRDVQNYRIGAKISAINRQTYVNSPGRQLVQSTDIVFATTPPNTYDGDKTVERMVITDGGYVGIGVTNPVTNLQVEGKIYPRYGIYPTATYYITGSYTANTWYTVFNYTAIPSGTYIMKAYFATSPFGGGSYDETYSGIFSWWAGGTNSTNADTISTHRAGHAPNAEVVSFRTLRNGYANGNHLQFQFSTNTSWTNVTSGNVRIDVILLA